MCTKGCPCALNEEEFTVAMNLVGKNLCKIIGV
jgi:hypothetical protein